MKNRLLTCALIIFTLIPLILPAQSWQPVGLGCGTNDRTEAVFSMVVYKDTLYAAGIFATAGGIPASSIAKWDGTTWSPVGLGITDAQGQVRSMAVYNNELYVAGFFHSAGGISVNNIAKWTGASWSAVGGGITADLINGVSINTLAVYNGKLYAGGLFQYAESDSANNIARWDGNSWSALPGLYSRYSPPTGIQYGIAGTVNVLYPYAGKLYVGGAFPYNATYYPPIGFFVNTENIATWNDTFLFPLLDTLNYAQQVGGVYESSVNAITSYNGELYISGKFDTAGHSVANNIAKWTGYSWESVSNSYSGMGISTYGGSLIGGSLSGSGVAVVKLSGSSWTNMGSAFTGSYPTYYTLCEWNGELYAGGQFSLVGTNSVSNIAKWTPATGIQENKSNTGIVMYPNPANAKIFIEHLEPNQEIRITDLLGSVVMQGVTDEKGSKVLDISHLAPGMYFVSGLKFIKE